MCCSRFPCGARIRRFRRRRKSLNRTQFYAHLDEPPTPPAGCELTASSLRPPPYFAVLADCLDSRARRDRDNDEGIKSRTADLCGADVDLVGPLRTLALAAVASGGMLQPQRRGACIGDRRHNGTRLP